MKTLILLTLLLAPAQSTEYGKPEELQYLARIFVDTGANLRDRERIIKELKKSKIPFEILDSEDGAQVVMAFGAASEERLSGVLHNRQGTLSTPVYRDVKQGKGTVFVVKDGKARLVLSFEDEMRLGWEREPATNFARAFVKAWKKASGMK